MNNSIIKLPSHVVAVDTETFGFSGPPWSAQYSLRPGHGQLVFAHDGCGLGKLRRVLTHPRVLTVVHNALFDLRVLGELDIYPAHVLDTMIMAYLLGEASLKLKVLAYRYAQMEMQTYEEVTQPYSEQLARPWLDTVAGYEWEDSEPVIEENSDGTVHIRQPQNLRKRLASFLKKYDKGTAKQGLVDYWNDAKREADREMVEPVFGTIPEATLADVPLDEAVVYGCTDSDATGRIFPPLWERIVQFGLTDVLERDMAILPMVLEMMQNGMKIDLDHLARISDDLEVEAYQLQVRINQLAGVYLNPSSPPRVLAALNARGLNLRSTEAGELDKHRGDELVRAVQDCRAVRKLKSTYVDVLPKLVDERGRIHTKLSTTTAITGRLSSSKPNLQNQPVRTEAGRRIRDGFVADDGNLLVALDLSQIELRVAAHMSGDDALINAYLNDEDIHTRTASEMFGVAPENVDSYKHRRPGKTTNFSIIYGISPQGLLARFYHEDITEFTVDDCARFIDVWLDRHPGYVDWMEETKAFAIRNGYVVDMFGRRRWVPEVYSADDRIREGGYREAVNSPVQSGAQGIIKEAMRQLWPRVNEWKKSGAVVLSLLQVHDELIFEVGLPYVDAVVYEFAPIIENAVELVVPVKVGVKTGARWGSLKEIKS